MLQHLYGLCLVNFTTFNIKHYTCILSATSFPRTILRFAEEMIRESWNFRRTRIVLPSWISISLSLIHILAGMQSIPSEIIESARIDGANTVDIFSKIVIPNVKRMIQVCIIINLSGAIKTFDIPYMKMCIRDRLLIGWGLDLKRKSREGRSIERSEMELPINRKVKNDSWQSIQKDVTCM